MQDKEMALDGGCSPFWKEVIAGGVEEGEFISQ